MIVIQGEHLRWQHESLLIVSINMTATESVPIYC